MTVETVEQRRPAHSSRVIFPVVAAGMLAVSVALWWFVDAAGADLTPRSAVIAGGVLCLAFLAGEIFPLRVEIRRETLLISVSELPLVIGLLLVPVWLVGVAHLVAGAIVYLCRRDSWQNIALNLSLILMETAVAGLIAQRIAGGPLPGMDGNKLAYLGVAIGVLVAALASAVSVGLTYRMLGPAEPLLRVVVRSMIPATAIVTFALVAYNVWRSPGGPVLCAALAVVLVIVYKTYFDFLRQHADLAKMYSFGRRVIGVSTSDDDWRDLLEHVRDQLNASVAALHLDHNSELSATLVVGPDGPMTEPPVAPGDPLLARAEEQGSAKVSTDRTSDPAEVAALAARQAWDVMVVPLRSGNRNRGFLEVRDRRSRWGRFSDNDLTLLETLAGHVATSLDNLRLLDSLRNAAYHDAITGLRNRLGFMVAVSEGRDSAARSVMLVELDVLSQVNNALGHDRGEHLLRMAGSRLVEAAGATRPVARIEADRFAILLDAASEEQVVAQAQQLRGVVGAAYSLNGIEVDPNASAGVAHLSCDDGATDVSVLLQRAEMAMLAAQSNEESLQVYRPSMGEVYRRRFQLVTQFRQAVEQGLIVVHYQPKLKLGDREVVGAEALVRWMHPEFGLVSPAEFVEAIEATGSIDILLEHVLDIVLHQMAEWRTTGIRIGIAVNLSVRNLLAENFLGMVRRSLATYDVDPELLTFEITESSVMTHPEHSLPILRELATLGVRLSVDDFGTGYSSLAYLRRLPIDEIKIDRSFVQGMNTDLGDLAIVRAIVDLGHSLGLLVVAEGVEEEAARDVLRTMECDQIQGFLLSRPLAIDRFEAWLESRTVRIPGAEPATHVLRLMK